MGPLLLITICVLAQVVQMTSLQEERTGSQYIKYQLQYTKTYRSRAKQILHQIHQEHYHLETGIAHWFQGWLQMVAHATKLKPLKSAKKLPSHLV